MTTPIGPASIAYTPYGIDPSQNNNRQVDPVSGQAVPDISGAEQNVAVGKKPCRTWASRTYQDRSGDPAVSFQAPTAIPPELAAGAVSAHEQEHVQHNALEAKNAGMKATSVVQINTAFCPECGRAYVSGGTTTTTYTPESQSTLGNDQQKGMFVNIQV